MNSTHTAATTHKEIAERGMKHGHEIILTNIE